MSHAEQKQGAMRKNQLGDVRFMEIENEGEWGTIGSIFWIQYTFGKKPKGFLIYDKIFAKTFEYTFEEIWKKAEIAKEKN